MAASNSPPASSSAALAAESNRQRATINARTAWEGRLTIAPTISLAVRTSLFAGVGIVRGLEIRIGKLLKHIAFNCLEPRDHFLGQPFDEGPLVRPAHALDFAPIAVNDAGVGADAVRVRSALEQRYV